MPELPEVETIRIGLEPHLVGRTFEEVEIEDPRLTRPYDPREVAAELIGEKVESLERRGKYLVVRFETGRVLLIHLRMTGSLLLLRDGAEAYDLHRRAVVAFRHGRVLCCSLPAFGKDDFCRSEQLARTSPGGDLDRPRLARPMLAPQPDLHRVLPGVSGDRSGAGWRGRHRHHQLLGDAGGDQHRHRPDPACRGGRDHHSDLFVPEETSHQLRE